MGLFEACVARGASPDVVSAWSNSRREQYIAEKMEEERKHKQNLEQREVLFQAIERLRQSKDEKIPWEHKVYERSPPPHNGQSPMMKWQYDLWEVAKAYLAVMEKTDNRPEAFLELLERQSKELNPDYPFNEKSNAFDQLWSVTAALEGTRKANDDLHALIKKKDELVAATIGVDNNIRIHNELRNDNCSLSHQSR